MNYRGQRALRQWDEDVSDEMARLIEAGVPPIDAAEQAARNVSELRKAKVRARIESYSAETSS